MTPRTEARCRPVSCVPGCPDKPGAASMSWTRLVVESAFTRRAYRHTWSMPTTRKTADSARRNVIPEPWGSPAMSWAIKTVNGLMMAAPYPTA